MPINAYCRKCKEEVPPGEVCPLCGGKLPKNSLRLSWYYERHPATDWISWNNVCRVLLPAAALVAALVLGGEWLARGITGVQTLLAQGVAQILMGVTALSLAGTGLWLSLAGRDLIYYILDGKGVHIQTYLPNPTMLKLRLRMQGNHPAERYEIAGRQEEMMLLGEKLISWQEARRVQLWPEKEKILIYSPRWWLAAAVHCTPDTYEDAAAYLYQRLQKKKDVILPPALAMMEASAAPEAPTAQEPPPSPEEPP